MIILKKNEKIFNKFSFIYKKKVLVILIILIVINTEIKHFGNKMIIMKKLRTQKKMNYEFTNKTQSMISLEKKNLIEFISKSSKKNITFVKYFFVGNNQRFGNMMKTIYKIIFYCKLLGCKKILLDKKKIWFIKKKIIDKQYKIIIEPEEIKKTKLSNVIIDRTNNIFYYFNSIKLIKRIDLVKNEILNNLPILKANQNDLFIYIRSGDIFIHPHKLYAQAPLCFYEKIFDKNIFRNIYLIAENKNNPVIDKLLNKYPKIIYKKNPLNVDISYLTQAYNIVAGRMSTFLDAIIPLNNHLYNLYIFTFQNYTNKHKNRLKINYNIKIKIYFMLGSSKYIINFKK